VLGGADQVRKSLRSWRTDSDLASVQDKAALEQLPEPERESWKKLRAGVDDLLKKTEPTK
jgi:hypothetical protein